MVSGKDSVQLQPAGTAEFRVHPDRWSRGISEPDARGTTDLSDTTTSNIGIRIPGPRSTGWLRERFPRATATLLQSKNV